MDQRLTYGLRFFFSSRRRHTRYWRDWSSDVCSSDLIPRGIGFVARNAEERNVSGSSRNCTAPISPSSCRISSAKPFESAPKRSTEHGRGQLFGPHNPRRRRRLATHRAAALPTDEKQKA